MTQEDKELLLLKDLLGRVLYDVKVDYHGDIFTLGYNLYLNNSNLAFINYPMLFYLEKKIESIKPYLRPMSSMTEEEINEFILISDTVLWLGNKKSTCILSLEQMDWLNKNMFDYRGLIDKGLALEAPEGMYKFE